jgi:Na+/melibiose symporter-like transporter
MKQKIITFILAFLIFGLLFGVFNYFTEANRNLNKAIGMGVYFGISMGLFEVFVQPKIKKYFSKRRNS